MKRAVPVVANAELDLYVRTVYSLLRSSGEVDVRAFEEAHAYSHSSLHEGALTPLPDLSAFGYAAGRLPACITEVKRIVLGQSHELFEAAGHQVREWEVVKTRGRRRPLRFNGKDTLAVFIASASDIDDLVPIVTAYQIEWNKMHALLSGLGSERPSQKKVTSNIRRAPSPTEVAQLLSIDEAEVERLLSAFGGPERAESSLLALARRPMKLKMRMLASSHSQYQRAAQRWWSGVEPVYMQTTRPSDTRDQAIASLPKPSRRSSASEKSHRPPVYFVSSNTHAVANLMGGFARTEQAAIAEWAKRTNVEGLAESVLHAESAKSEKALLPLVHYLLRHWIHADPRNERMRRVRSFEAAGGVHHLSGPGNIDVDAQLVEIAKLTPERLDPRLLVPGFELLAKSDATIINIDYPLGMAAYHLLSRVGQGVGELRGVYVMGKAATLNGRVGDVMLSNVVYDEHSQNTFLFSNAFHAKDFGDLQYGSVLDNQKAVTVRSAFLQNKEYMTHVYREGYSVLEMEAGPFLAATYELANPQRVPQDEIVNLAGELPFDLGIVHYASDTPYSRRQSLLSKSLSYFGVDATYGCAIAIVRRILEREVARLKPSR